MDIDEAVRLAQEAQNDPDGETVVAWVGEAPTRFFVTFQPAPVPSIGGETIMLLSIPHAGQWAVDKETGVVEGFRALPGQEGTEDYWAARTVWRHPQVRA